MAYRDLDFAIIGPPNSGTTWLAHQLRQHPEIELTHEINFITWTEEKRNLDFDSVLNTDHHPGKICGEHSNTYIYYTGVAPELYERNSDLKLIVSVADPVDRVIKSYRHDIRWGHIGRHLKLDMLVLEDFFYFRYIQASKYVDNINRFLEYFAPEQIYLFFSPTLQADATVQFRHLLEYLGTTEAHIPTGFQEPVNQSLFTMFPQIHRYATFGDKPNMKRLAGWFDPVNRALGKLLPPPHDQNDRIVVANALGTDNSLRKTIEFAQERRLPGADFAGPMGISCTSQQPAPQPAIEERKVI